MRGRLTVSAQWLGIGTGRPSAPTRRGTRSPSLIRQIRRPKDGRQVAIPVASPARFFSPQDCNKLVKIKTDGIKKRSRPITSDPFVNSLMLVAFPSDPV